MFLKGCVNLASWERKKHNRSVRKENQIWILCKKQWTKGYHAEIKDDVRLFYSDAWLATNCRNLRPKSIVLTQEEPQIYESFAQANVVEVTSLQ